MTTPQKVRVTKTATEDVVKLQKQMDDLSFMLANKSVIEPAEYNKIQANKVHTKPSKKEEK